MAQEKSDEEERPVIVVLGRDGWMTYTNGRFGCSIAVPPGMGATRPPDNGGGQEFATPDGKVRLLVGGYFNIDETDLVSEEYEQALAKKNRTITYKRKTADWYVVSGVTADGTGFYEKLTANKKYASGWSMTYPQSQEKLYAPWIERIAKEYRANLGKGHDTVE